MILPLIAIGIGVFSACFAFSYKRPLRFKTKNNIHSFFKVSWRGKASMGIIITLLLVEHRVYGAFVTSKAR